MGLYSANEVTPAQHSAGFIAARSRAYLIFLAADALSVGAIAATSYVHARMGDGHGAGLIAACAGVGVLSWGCAVVAAPSLRWTSSTTAARRWIWAGLIVNSVGSSAIGMAALFPDGVLDGVAVTPGLAAAAFLLGGGIAVSAGYLHTVGAHAVFG